MEEALIRLLDTPERPAAETQRLARLTELFLRLPPPPLVEQHFPRFEALQAALEEAVAERYDEEALEENILELYAHLHMHEAPYSAAERHLVDATGGYWAHAGGLSPVLKAGPHLSPDCVSMDLGAGNGLQGLLLQFLDPHHLTVQVEISHAMVEIGRMLQGWLGIPEGRIRWIVGDVLETSVKHVDFLYLYRPVRPEGPGAALYRRLARELAESAHQVVVFSVADCLFAHLEASFERFYFDGHLSCFRRRPLAAPGTS